MIFPAFQTLRFQTLRFRLTFWNTIVLLLACLLALWAAREGMRMTLLNETRDLLREETTELELAVNQLYPEMESVHDELTRKIRGHSQHGWFAELKDESGQTLWRSESYPDDLGAAYAVVSNPPNVTQLSIDRGRGTQAGSRFQFIQTPDSIVVEHPFQLPAGESFQITLGTDTAFIQRDVWSLTKVMLGIGFVLFLIAPVTGFVLARNATQPVREIIDTTRRLNPANLEQRLVLRGSGDELDQLSGEINSFLDQISKYLQSHREFIANAAHELRSPLTAIQTSLDVSLEKNRTTEEYREELGIVSEQCDELRHLVNALLQLAETDVAAGLPKFSEVDLSALVRKSIDVFSGVAEEQGVRLVADLGIRIFAMGVESKIRQVVNNLLDNSLNFTPRDGTVRLSLDKYENGVRLRVTDTGCGIPADEVSKVFDRFYQVDRSRNRAARRGNGLGLSICKSIVEMHGGSISITLPPEGGTQVEVVLPSS
jgi:signal transduction histidine kinase